MEGEAGLTSIRRTLSVEGIVLTGLEDEQDLNKQRKERFSRQWVSVSESNVGKHCHPHGNRK